MSNQSIPNKYKLSFYHGVKIHTSAIAQRIAQFQFCYEYFDPNIAPMQQAHNQTLLFFKRLTEFHTFPTIQPIHFPRTQACLCTAAAAIAPLHSCRNNSWQWQMFAQTSVLINICWRVVEKKIPLSLTDSQKPENLFETEYWIFY